MVSPSERENLAGSLGRKSDPDDMGLDAQFAINSQKAERDGFSIPDDPAFRFEDDDTSGTTTTRGGLDRLVAIVTSGNAPFSRVYVKDTTREGRFADPRFHFFLQVLFEQHDVKLCYSDREQQLDFSEGTDPSDMYGLLFKDLVESITGAQELARLIKRVTEGMRIWAMRGFYPGGRPPYATERWYADERTGEVLEPVDEHAIQRQKGVRLKLRFRRDETPGVVRRIFEEVEGGRSLSRTAGQLNDDNVPGPSGGEWYPEAVRRITRNPIYRGALVWGRTTRSADPEPKDEVAIDGEAPVLVEDFIPDPPISRSQFDRVQRILDGNVEAHDRRRRRSPAYPLSGLVVCDVCGGAWHGHTSTAQNRSRRRYYRHGAVPKSHGTDCPNLNRYLRADFVEPIVEVQVRLLLQDDELVKATQEALSEMIDEVQSEDHEQQAAELSKKLESQKSKLDRLTDDRGSAETKEERESCQRNIDRVNRRIQSLKRQIGVHESALQRAREMAQSVDRAAARASDLLDLYGDATPAERRAVYEELVHRIAVSANVEEVQIEVQPF